MSLRAFLALALTTLLTVVAVVFLLTAQNRGPAPREPGTAILPELAANLDKVSQIVMTRAGEKTTIRRAGSGDDAKWTVAEFSDYPSHPLLIRDVLAGLAQIQTLEGKTRRPDLYSKLDVDDPTTPEARSTRIEAIAGDKKVADIIVGKVKSAIGGDESLYVRRPDEDRAWLARGKVDLPQSRIGWVNNEVLVVDLPRIQHATLNTPAKGPRVQVFKTTQDERDFTIAGMPAGYEVKDIFGAEDVARVVQQLSFEDVRPADKLKIDTTAKPWAEFVTFDGLKIELWLRQAEGKPWVALRAAAAPKKAAKADQAEGETPRDVAGEITAINERVTPWVYAIPSYEAGNLRKTLESLVQKKPADKTPAKSN